MLNRRDFLEYSLKSAILLGIGNKLVPWAGSLFTLPPEDQVSLRFAVVSDGHYGQPQTQFDQMHDLVIQALNREHSGRGIDFTFVNGDLFHDDPGFLLPVKKKWDELAMPYQVSHGNHDKISEQGWKDVFGNEWHYSFKKKNCSFLVLNTASPQGEYICPDLEKTRDMLKAHKKSKHLFVFMHITPYKWSGGGIECPDITALFNRHSNIKAVFHGHDHDIDEVRTKDGIHYVFDAHVGGSWGLPYSGYRIVEVMKDGTILTYQMNAGLGKQMNSDKLGALVQEMSR
ncbi:metallophosphoesterase family protein [Flavihumibacter profundi]|uniref:metallophosphoesterase family protein n=1 Tax=Flavihumibacter profundi TaxID=2716883 RepID=UPI001CC62D08|nr:metallophosphoesterase [Flavihumibacter profundi]MBZ5857692.1 metallophosphoesterase [Flavihumibacter profundi]